MKKKNRRPSKKTKSKRNPIHLDIVSKENLNTEQHSSKKKVVVASSSNTSVVLEKEAKVASVETIHDALSHDKNNAIIQLKNVSKTFYVFDQQASFLKRLASVFFPAKYSKEVAALKKINFSVKKGEFFGVIGRNGSGKSTLLKIIMGAMDPNQGSEIITDGKMIRLALGMGFDPNLTARDNIFLNGTILGMTFKEISSRFDDIISFAELEKFVDTPIRFFSSGMRSRLAFSVAVNATSDIYLIDEFFGGVGDISFKDKSKKVFSDRLISGKTILFVSHSMELIKQNCDRVMVIDKGEGYVFDDVLEGIKYYKNTFQDRRK